MLTSVFSERDISGCPRHCKSGIACFWFYCLNIISVVARSRTLRFLCSQKTAISAGNWKLRGLLCRREMNKVLFQIGTGSLGLTHVKVLLHAFVAGFLPLVILVVETVLGLRVLPLALVTQRVLHVCIVLCCRNLWELLLVREVTLSSVTNRHLVEFVTASVPCDQSRLINRVLMWHLQMQFFNAGRQYESLGAAHAKFYITERSIGIRRVGRGWWGGTTLKVNITPRKPRKFCFGVHAPRRLVYLTRHHYFLPSHLWQVVIGRASPVQVRGHCLDILLIACSVTYVFWAIWHSPRVL